MSTQDTQPHHQPAHQQPAQQLPAQHERNHPHAVQHEHEHPHAVQHEQAPRPPAPYGAAPQRAPGWLPQLIFASRWLQLPLYLGLIVAQALYAYQFWVELVELLAAAAGDTHAVASLQASVGHVSPDGHLTETTVMLVVLGLIDVVMISNLLIMVIVGGYETFVSRMNLKGHPDEPEWLSHVNASVLKVKLSTAIIGISSIHLLKTFINAENYDAKALIAQTGIHLTFLVSALAIAMVDRILESSRPSHAH